jgi:hypothetical protein
MPSFAGQPPDESWELHRPADKIDVLLNLGWNGEGFSAKQLYSRVFLVSKNMEACIKKYFCLRDRDSCSKELTETIR